MYQAICAYQRYLAQYMLTVTCVMCICMAFIVLFISIVFWNFSLYNNIYVYNIMYIIYIRTYNIYVYNIYVYNSGAIKTNIVCPKLLFWENREKLFHFLIFDVDIKWWRFLDSIGCDTLNKSNLMLIPPKMCSYRLVLDK